MLTVLAHTGRAPEPHDLWGAWNLDPVIVTGLVVAGLLYSRGRPDRRWRKAADTRRWVFFLVGLGAIAVALISPLDALSRALASAHMVQHVLLILVAAPLLALSAPGTMLYRGTPPAVRRAGARTRRRLRVPVSLAASFTRPAVAWVAAVSALWVWHSAALYDAALANEAVHVAEHVSFLATALLFWWVVTRSHGRHGVSQGIAVLLVFGMGMQSVFLSVLLTFAQRPWYGGYDGTTAAWGLDPLADQQLAGAIMWVPAGAVYVAAGLTLFVLWLRGTETQPSTGFRPEPPG